MKGNVTWLDNVIVKNEESGKTEYHYDTLGVLDNGTISSPLDIIYEFARGNVKNWNEFGNNQLSSIIDLLDDAE